jgi:hypothetical protein
MKLAEFYILRELKTLVEKSIPAKKISLNWKPWFRGNIFIVR